MAKARASKSKREPPSKNGLVWGTLFFLIGVVLLSMGGWVWKLGFETTLWPQVPAVILDATISASQAADTDVHHTQRRETLSLSVSYRYEVAGQTYIGGGLERGTLSSSDVKPVSDRWGTLTPGQKVTVAVNPADPKESYLAPGVSRLAYILGGPGLAAMVFGVMFFGAYRKTRQLYLAGVEPSKR